MRWQSSTSEFCSYLVNPFQTIAKKTADLKNIEKLYNAGCQKKNLARNKISWSSFRGVTFSSPNSPTCWKWYSWAPHDNASHLFDTLEGRCCEPVVVSNPSQVGRCGWCHYTMMPVETWRWRRATPPVRRRTTKKKSKYRGSNGLLLLGILWSCHGPFHNLYITRVSEGCTCGLKYKEAMRDPSFMHPWKILRILSHSSD